MAKRRQNRPPKKIKKHRPHAKRPSTPLPASRAFGPHMVAAAPGLEPAPPPISSDGPGRQHLHVDHLHLPGNVGMHNVTVMNANKAGILIMGEDGYGVPATDGPVDIAFTGRSDDVHIEAEGRAKKMVAGTGDASVKRLTGRLRHRPEKG